MNLWINRFFFCPVRQPKLSESNSWHAKEDRRLIATSIIYTQWFMIHVWRTINFPLIWRKTLQDRWSFQNDDVLFILIPFLVSHSSIFLPRSITIIENAMVQKSQPDLLLRTGERCGFEWILNAPRLLFHMRCNVFLELIKRFADRNWRERNFFIDTRTCNIGGWLRYFLFLRPFNEFRVISTGRRI